MGEGRNKSIDEVLSVPLAAAVSITKDHLVVELDGSGNAILGTAAGVPYGVTNRSTQDKIARTVGITQYNNGSQVPDVGIIRSGIVELELGSTNIAIAKGDRIVVHADDDGTVNGAGAEDTTSAATLLAALKATVGFAEEAKGVNVGGKIKVALKLFKGDAP